MHMSAIVEGMHASFLPSTTVAFLELPCQLANVTQAVLGQHMKIMTWGARALSDAFK